MKSKRTIFTALFIFSMVSCGWNATKQDIKTMEDTRTAALKAEDTANKKNIELGKLKKEVEAAQAKKKAADKELNKVKSELSRRSEKSGEKE